jgi:hypothetical protein
MFRFDPFLPSPFLPSPSLFDSSSRTSWTRTTILASCSCDPRWDWGFNKRSALEVHPIALTCGLKVYEVEHFETFDIATEAYGRLSRGLQLLLAGSTLSSLQCNDVVHVNYSPITWIV